MARYFVSSTIDRMGPGSSPMPTRSTLLSVLTHPAASDVHIQVGIGLLRNQKDSFLEIRGTETSELRKHENVLDFDKFFKSKL